MTVSLFKSRTSWEVDVKMLLISSCTQLEACRNLISTLETSYPDSDFPCLMKASLLHREKHSDKAVELLKVQSNHLIIIDTRNIAVILMGDGPLCKSLKYQHGKTTPDMQKDA